MSIVISIHLFFLMEKWSNNEKHFTDLPLYFLANEDILKEFETLNIKI